MKGPFAKLSIGSLITLIFIFVVGVFLLAACLIVAIHRVQEGYVGVYYKNGALVDDISDPGPIIYFYKECMSISLCRNEIE